MRQISFLTGQDSGAVLIAVLVIEDLHIVHAYWLGGKVTDDTFQRSCVEDLRPTDVVVYCYLI